MRQSVNSDGINVSRFAFQRRHCTGVNKRIVEKSGGYWRSGFVRAALDRHRDRPDAVIAVSWHWNEPFLIWMRC